MNISYQQDPFPHCGTSRRERADLEWHICREVPELKPHIQLIKAILRKCQRGDSIIRVVFTDIDDSFVLGGGKQSLLEESGDERERALARKVHSAAESMAELIEAHGDILFPISGTRWAEGNESTDSVRDRLMDGRIPQPLAALSVNGGAEIYGVNPELPPSQWGQDPYYAAFMDKRLKSFESEHVFTKAQQLADRINHGETPLVSQLPFEEIAAIDPIAQARLAMFPQPSVHPEDKPFATRASFHFYANSIAEMDLVENLFSQHFPEYSVVVGTEGDYQAKKGDHSNLPDKYYLDISPYDKGAPIGYFLPLIKRALLAAASVCNKTAPEIEVWYCGDAGNDRIAASQSEVDIVCMVGAALPELVRLKPRLEETGKRVLLAQRPGYLAAISTFRALIDRAYHPNPSNRFRYSNP